MTQIDTTALDRSERLTASGIGALRIAAGLFFLIPGLYKTLSPGDFLVLLDRFPPVFAPYADLLFLVATAFEVVGGAALLLGFNARLFVLPLAMIAIVAGVVIVPRDTASAMRDLSIWLHIGGAAFYAGLFFLGSGRWALDGGRDLFARWGDTARPGARAAHWVVSGAGRNFGVFLIRVAIAFPFLAAAIATLGPAAIGMGLPASDWLSAPILALAAIGGLSVLTAFRIRTFGWVLAALTALHFALVALPDANTSQIGLINLLFHGLTLSALLCLRLIRFGSDLEIEHILGRDKKNVVVIGGGFAGTAVAKRLEKKLPLDWRVSLISEETYTTFNPLLAEIVSGSIAASHATAPIRRMLRRTRVVNARVTAVDFDRQRVIMRTPGGRKGAMAWDHVVFAFGSRANLGMFPGLAEHALPFKLMGDALRTRNRVIQQLEKAELESDPERRRRQGRFVIIGAGFSGVEVAGAVHDYITAAQPHYPRLHDGDLNVTVIHSGDLPTPELHPALGRAALKNLRDRGIDVILNARAAAIDAEGVVLQGGERVNGGMVICTIGATPNPLVEQLDAPKEKGRLKVEADMTLAGRAGAWAIGDCAFVPNAHDGALAPPTAQFALREGRQLADNILRAIDGRETRPFRYRARGALATVGHLNGLADLGFVRLSGFPAWIVWRGFYLALMPTIAKKTRIAFEWLWSLLFSVDISDLRFTTSQGADAAPATVKRAA